jgi:hypothetical protein
MMSQVLFSRSPNVGLAMSLPSTLRHAHARHGASPRDGAEHQRERGAGEGQHVRGVDAVRRHDGGDDLDLGAPVLGEERAARAVDEARRQRLVVAQAALALEEATGDLTGGVGLLDVLAGEREERHAGARLVGAAHGHEHDGLAAGDEDGAVRLLGDATGLEA